MRRTLMVAGMLGVWMVGVWGQTPAPAPWVPHVVMTTAQKLPLRAQYRDATGVETTALPRIAAASWLAFDASAPTRWTSEGHRFTPNAVDLHGTTFEPSRAGRWEIRLTVLLDITPKEGPAKLIAKGVTPATLHRETVRVWVVDPPTAGLVVVGAPVAK